MKLLLDQNLSFRLIGQLSDLFPGSVHVRLLGMHEADDRVIWNYARENGFMIVTQDSDFHERSILFGFPPKVIWIKVGNTSSQHILHVIQTHYRDIELFENDRDSGCLELY
ncbi:DUF5615 family PIN-like protein [bacterium]|nr:DUF5615 family PIN-like protein [bacterium]